MEAANPGVDGRTFRGRVVEDAVLGRVLRDGRRGGLRCASRRTNTYGATTSAYGMKGVTGPCCDVGGVVRFAGRSAGRGAVRGAVVAVRGPRACRARPRGCRARLRDCRAKRQSEEWSLPAETVGAGADLGHGGDDVQAGTCGRNLQEIVLEVGVTNVVRRAVRPNRGRIDVFIRARSGVF